MKYKTYSFCLLKDLGDIKCDMVYYIRDVFDLRVITSRDLMALTLAVSEMVELKEIKAVTIRKTDNGYRYEFTLYNDATVIAKIVRSRTKEKPSNMIWDKISAYGLLCHIGDEPKKRKSYGRR
jgi:hypothetical protein